MSSDRNNFDLEVVIPGPGEAASLLMLQVEAVEAGARGRGQPEVRSVLFNFTSPVIILETVSAAAET